MRAVLAVLFAVPGFTMAAQAEGYPAAAEPIALWQALVAIFSS